MKELNHLQVYDLLLSVRSPLFVGTGRSLAKNEYLYNSKRETVSFVNEQAFLSLLAERGLVDKYEAYILSGDTDLYSFLREICGLTDMEIRGVTSRPIEVGNAMGKNGNKTQIYRFQRNKAGRAYIPGSSLKGALRTVWLAARILEETPSNRNFRQSDAKDRSVNPIPEENYVNLLRCNEKRETDAVNSIFRGISVSDSEPISDRTLIILCRKWDIHPDGGCHDINLIRECVCPGATIRFQVTLDQFLLNQRITAESLMADIAVFVQFYREHYLSHFTLPENAVDPLNDRCLFLEGGPGLFSKSLTYPYWGDADGLEDVSAFLDVLFKGHKHVARDRDFGISPRTLKYTEYKDHLYPFGIGQVSFQ
ncbi:MAG: type III-A CRISPR-associated RAMP protein Csm5 [Oscillospiraceae bacterium]|nr:type III-A CRISPR-associated RAMP protein Csm5 [Oscillospiraceae bacterium]